MSSHNDEEPEADDFLAGGYRPVPREDDSSSSESGRHEFSPEEKIRMLNFNDPEAARLQDPGDDSSEEEGEEAEVVALFRNVMTESQRE